ncbi:MAG: hypothetical protein AMXMBFR81_14700 [Chthonomonas sp.]
MTLVVSTSSPLASLALFDGADLVAAAECGEGRAHQTLFGMLDQVLEGRPKAAVRSVVADVGPGGFTAVRIGVTFAKTWAHFERAELRAISAFDLISPLGIAVIGVRRGSYVLRVPGEPLSSVLEVPDGVPGHGVGVLQPTYPHASRYVPSASRLSEALSLVPEYILEPSISTPKRPLGRGTA